MWIEVRVKDDNGIRGVEVDANTSSPRGQKVDEDFRARLIKFIDTLLTECTRCFTVL